MVSCPVSGFNDAFRGQALSFKFVLKHPRNHSKITKEDDLNFSSIYIISSRCVYNFSHSPWIFKTLDEVFKDSETGL